MEQVTIYITMNELLSMIQEFTNIKQLYETHSDKIFNLRQSEGDNINFCFSSYTKDEEGDNTNSDSDSVKSDDKHSSTYHTISMLLNCDSRGDVIAELTIYDSDDTNNTINNDSSVEVYAMDYHKYEKYIKFDQVMDNLHLLAKSFGYKKLYLFDHALKDIGGKPLPISLVRKLAGKSFFYEKYGYHMEFDIKDIELNFNNFCDRQFDPKLNKTIRDYFALIDSDRNHNLSNIFTNVLNFIFGMQNNEPLFEMSWAIQAYPFYKTLV